MQVKISFIVLGSRKQLDGKVPIYCRLSRGNQTARFATGHSIVSTKWDPKRQKAKGGSIDATLLNQQLSSFEDVLKKIQIKLMASEREFSVEDIISEFKGKQQKPIRTLIEVYDLKIGRMKNLVGKGYAPSSIVKQNQMKKALNDFLKHSYSSNDISLSKVNKGFIGDFEAYLRIEKSMKPITSNKVVQALKSALKLAFDHGWMVENPFAGHAFKHERIEVVFLDIEELKRLEEFQFSQPRLNLVKDLFLFSAYTGLHYNDAMSLTKQNLVIGLDGNLWIEYVRQKTDKVIRVPLFSKAKQLIDHFIPQVASEEYILPRFSNQKINSYLKEIADISGIRKALTHKVARKTFGSLLLYHNTPMAVVSELMGHSSVLITQKHYAKLEFKRLGEAIRLIDHVI